MFDGLFAWKKWLITGIVIQLLLILCGAFTIRTVKNHLLSIPISIETEADVGVQGYRLPIMISERFQMSAAQSKGTVRPHLFDDLGLTQPLLWGNIRPQNKTITITVPLDLKKKTRKYYYLEWLEGGQSIASKPDEAEFHEYSGQEGNNIRWWKLDQIQAEDPIYPFEGDKMMRLTIKPAPVDGDHNTNFEIPLLPVPDKYVDDLTCLSYAIYYPRASKLRVSIQAKIGADTTELNSSVDQNYVPCHWAASLDDHALGRWFHRIIPLGQYAGFPLESLTLYVNDEPALTSNECHEPVVVYIDGVHLFSGKVPAVFISNPLREFFRAVVAVPVFLIALCSVIFWLLWLSLVAGQPVSFL
ncbi:hypothetical protein ACFL27_21865 [candidate division CSSED10-310 bacterium]|uniref:Uncharacterized protein n=1 Tax=candidate division CSSED10-310 bacterium TaxID=2855610 RepID=A0ABV6Z376_UNCC1